MSLLGRVSQPTFAGAFFLLALVLASVSAGLQRFPLPSHDAEHYLGYARSLYLTGQFAATPQGPAADRTPGREPLYSVLVAGTAKVVPALGRALADCAPLAEPCKGGLRLLVFVNAALLALGATFALLTVIELGGTRAAALIGGLYVACNGHMHADLVHTYSDFLAVALSCAASLALARACKSPFGLVPWAIAAVVVALLVLTKQIFFPYALLLTAGLCIFGLANLRAAGVRALLPVVVVGAILAATVGTWFARNVAHFGAAADSRGAVVLSTREVFDAMGWRENLAAFVVWTRGPGRRIAERTFPEAITDKFNQKNPDGYYIRGQYTNAERRVAEIQRVEGVPLAVAQAKAMRVVTAEIVADWPGYLASMPALIYRGLWFDEFILIGFPLLMIAIWRAVAARRTVLLVALSPGLFSILAYPAISLNIQRYQFTAVGALAIATGLLLPPFVGRLRGWLRRRS